MQTNPNRKNLSSIKPSILTAGLTLMMLLGLALRAHAELQLPQGSWPEGGSAGIRISTEHLESTANRFCEESNFVADVETFVMGYLAQTATEEICSADSEMVPDLLGQFYVSGLLGGIWLRDQLNPAEQVAAEKLFIPAKTVLELIASDIQDGIPLFMFKRIELITNLLLDFANTEVESDQNLALNLSIPLFLSVTGYNRGYLEYILQNSPQDVIAPTEFLLCEHFLYCIRPGMELSVLENYEYIIGQLESEPFYSLRWQWFKFATFLFGQGSQSLGAGVWQNIGVTGMNEEAYRLLIDLSARFLMISEVSLLSAMDGLGNGNSESAQCAFRQQAAMMAWMGSYFSGLASAQPRGTFAYLSCN